LTLLASFPLSAVAMFLLARHLLGECAGRNAGAVLAGFVFAFNPWHVAQVMHHARPQSQ
jgi:4-amino-4-deoxy-L-arabinose transferase-like glycosyltransferase